MFSLHASNVRPDDQILCSGDPRGASAMKTEEDIGPAVNHSFIVSAVFTLSDLTQASPAGHTLDNPNVGSVSSLMITCACVLVYM